MSTHEVKYTSIERVFDHPNADRLEIAQIKDTTWNVVVGKGQFGAGELCIYIPIDSVLPIKLEEYLFPPGSKIKLEKHRVRSIKIRGAISQGMAIEPTTELFGLYPKLKVAFQGENVAEVLGIIKYEPPISAPSLMRAGNPSKRHPDFKKYTDIENAKNFPGLFDPNESLYISEKVHGTSARFGLVPTRANTLWKRLKKWARLLPAYEYCVGSRNTQVRVKDGTYYSKNVYTIISNQLELEDQLAFNEIVYGEIVGDGIQKGYTYGCGKDEWKFLAYDIKQNGVFLGLWDFLARCEELNLTRVPVLHIGPLPEGMTYDGFSEGKSMVLDDGFMSTQPIREGIVVKPIEEEHIFMGRKVLKRLNDAYLLQKGNTDFH